MVNVSNKWYIFIFKVESMSWSSIIPIYFGHDSILYCGIWGELLHFIHYNDVKIGAMASQITSLTIVYSTVYSATYQRKHQSSASLAFVRGIHRWPVNSPHKEPVTRKMFPFDDVIMERGRPFGPLIGVGCRLMAHLARLLIHFLVTWG